MPAYGTANDDDAVQVFGPGHSYTDAELHSLWGTVMTVVLRHVVARHPEGDGNQFKYSHQAASARVSAASPAEPSTLTTGLLYDTSCPARGPFWGTYDTFSMVSVARMDWPA